MIGLNPFEGIGPQLEVDGAAGLGPVAPYSIPLQLTNGEGTDIDRAQSCVVGYGGRYGGTMVAQVPGAHDERVGQLRCLGVYTAWHIIGA